MLKRYILMTLVIAILVGIAVARQWSPVSLTPLTSTSLETPSICKRQVPPVLAPMVAGIGIEKFSESNSKVRKKLPQGFDSPSELFKLLNSLEPNGPKGQIQIG